MAKLRNVLNAGTMMASSLSVFLRDLNRAPWNHEKDQRDHLKSILDQWYIAYEKANSW